MPYPNPIQQPQPPDLLGDSAPVPASEPQMAPEAAPIASTDAQSAPISQPSASNGLSVWDISGPEPIQGTLPHEQVTAAIASGRYSLPQGDDIHVYSPDGDLGTLPRTETKAAFQAGYRYATPHDIKIAEHGTLGQQAMTGLEGVAEGLAGPIATATEVYGLGISPEDIAARKEASPWTHGIGTAVGLVAPAIASAGSSLAARAGISGASAVGKAALGAEAYTQAGALSHIGHAVAEAVGLGLPYAAAKAPAIARIGSAAVRGAVETGLYAAGEAVNDAILHQPHESIGYSVVEGGMLGLLGGTILGAGGVAGSKLWQAAKGSEMGKTLGAVVRHAGGMESAGYDEVSHMLEIAGISDLPAEAQAALRSPEMHRIWSKLVQVDSNMSGISAQNALKDANKAVAAVMVEHLGMTAADADALAEGFSVAKSGQRLGDVTAAEFKERLSGPVAAFMKGAETYGSHPLDLSMAGKRLVAEPKLAELQEKLDASNHKMEKLLKAGDVEAAIEHGAQLQDLRGAIVELQTAMSTPGTMDMLGDKIGQWAKEAGHVKNPDTTAMRAIDKIKASLPLQKTVQDLSNLITTTRSEFHAQGLYREARELTGILKEAEAGMIEKYLPGGAAEKAAARAAYRLESQIQDIIDEHLKVSDPLFGRARTTAGFPDAVDRMAKMDPEKIAQRLADKPDAFLLDTIQKYLPKTAEAIKRHQLEQIVARATQGRLEDAAVNPVRLMKALKPAVGTAAGISPEMRNFLLTPEAQAKIDAAGAVLERLRPQDYNYSNTARTLAAQMAHIPGAALGMVTGLLSHNPVIGAVVGLGVKALGKDIPDATRLALLRFMGSDVPINSGAFRSMAEFIAGAQKGEAKLSRAAKNVFRPEATEAVSPSSRPSARDIEKLDKKLQEIQEDPEALLKIGGDLGHYMPEHAAAIGEVSSNAVQYLNSLRPQAGKAGPLDTAKKPSPVEVAKFNRALTIAQSPEMILEHIKRGNITPDDVAVFKTLYPDLHRAVSQKLTDEMLDVVSKGKAVDYKTRLGLSLFLGQPMDSTMTPQAIAGAQPMPPQQQQPGAGKMPGPKKGTASLGKLPGSYETIEQSASKRRLK